MSDMHSSLAPLDWGTLLGTWQIRPGWTLALLLVATMYAACLRRAAHHDRRRDRRSVSPVRVAFFALAIVVWWVTISSSVATYGERVFWIHMVEHLLLIMVVPVLLVLGRPLTVIQAGTGDRVESVLSSRLVALVTHPLCALAIYTVVIVGTHLTGFMDDMMSHPWLMNLEEAMYVGAGWLLVVALIGGEPLPRTAPLGSRLFLSVVAMVPDTVVGLVLLQSDVSPFPAMARMRPDWAPAPLRDVQIGGGLMWVGGDLLMMLVSVGLIVTLISSPGRDGLLGNRLDSARRNALLDHIAHGAAPTTDGAGEAAFDPDTDVDADDQVLDAYNDMLGRLSRHRQG